MKKIFSLITIICLGLTTMAQSDIIYKGGSSTDPDAEYQLIRRHYTVNADGSSDFRFRKEIKIIRNRALTAYADKGESFIVWNPAIEKLTINECYTLRADGSKVEMPKNAFVEQLPSGCTDCGRYNGIREMAVVHTGMEYGCTIVLDYTIHRNSNIIADHFVVAQDCPVKEYEIIVDLPDKNDTSLNFHWSKGDGKFPCNATEINDIHAKHIRFHNVGQTYIDSYLPPASELYPTVSIAYKNILTLVSLPSNDTIADAALLLASCYHDDTMKYIKAIRDYVVDAVHLNNISPEHTGYTHADARTVWRSNCGTALDKAVLLTQLLRQAGMTADVVPGMQRCGQGSESFAISTPDRSMVQVTLGEMKYWVSPLRKDPLRLIGAAHDAVRMVTIDKAIDCQPEPLAGNYYKIVLPKEADALDIDPAQLTSVRTAPLLTGATDESYHYTVELPEGMRMVGKAVNITKNRSGLGSMQISVQQQGNTLDITRKLVLEKSTVSDSKDYKALREWLQLWSHHKEIIIK